MLYNSYALPRRARTIGCEMRSTMPQQLNHGRDAPAASATGAGSRPPAHPPDTILRIRLLGQFQVAIGPEVIPEEAWRLRKARSLVKLLALAPGHRLHRE